MSSEILIGVRDGTGKKIAQFHSPQWNCTFASNSSDCEPWHIHCALPGSSKTLRPKSRTTWLEEKQKSDKGRLYGIAWRHPRSRNSSDTICGLIFYSFGSSRWLSLSRSLWNVAKEGALPRVYFFVETMRSIWSRHRWASGSNDVRVLTWSEGERAFCYGRLRIQSI